LIAFLSATGMQNRHVNQHQAFSVTLENYIIWAVESVVELIILWASKKSQILT
jgi:hypothetical protein